MKNPSDLCYTTHMNKNTTAILQAQAAQLAVTTSVMPNSHASHVAARLRQAGFDDLASAYWSWSCNCLKVDWATAEVIANQAALKNKDNKNVMPAWGIAGT